MRRWGPNKPINVLQKEGYTYKELYSIGLRYGYKIAEEIFMKEIKSLQKIIKDSNSFK